MFVDIDPTKRKVEAKLHLAKPNKQIISHISEKFNDTLNVKLGDIHELNFSIPYMVDNEPNEHVNLIRERMLIRVTMGALYKHWFIVDSIEEDGEDVNVFNVKAYLLPYELRSKRISSIEEESINATDLLNELLQTSLWKVGYVDPIFDEMYRGFELSDSTVLDGLLQAAETYGALIDWDTENRKVSFLDVKNNGKFRGITINYGRFLRSIKRSRTTDEMVTRLYAYGNEDLSIYSVNPTGQSYIEDFSFFMYPFERDENRNVIKHSYYMSDELCHAILDHQALIEQNAPQIKSLTEQLLNKNTELITEQSKLNQLNGELQNIIELLDAAQATGDEATINQRKAERDAKQIEIQNQQLVVANIQNEIDNLNAQITQLQDQISHQANFTPELLDELNFYIIEKEWRDDRYTNADELYNDALNKFDEMRQPKIVIDVSIDNLLNIIDEQYYWDKLILGDLIKVKYPQMNIEYMAKIIEMNYDFENNEVNLTIANTKDFLDETEKLIQLLYNTSTSTALLENNKYKWNKINAVEDKVNQIITQEWDATKNKIIAGVNNSIEVGGRGIIVTNPDFPDEMIIIQSGVVALSKDKGETWKTAIKPDGIVAERLIGQIIAGQELLITNSTSTFTIDVNGIQVDADSFVVRSSSGDVNLLNIWNDAADFVSQFVDDNIITGYEKKMLKSQWNNITSRYNSTVVKLNGYYADHGSSIPEVAQYHQYYQDLYNYLFVDLQTDGYALLDENNITNSTRINRSVFESKFNNFTNQETKVDEILALRAKELADQAQEAANEAQDNINELLDDVVWKIELISSNGVIFKNNNINTTITARIFKGADDITDTLPPESFVWRKYDKNGVEDTAWYNAHLGVGNVITVTESDVVEKATFKCEVNVPDK